MNSLKQTTLNLSLKDIATFDNFLISSSNNHLVDFLKGLPNNSSDFFIYLWGKSGSGKSHLLYALSQLFGEHNLAVAYLPLEDINQLSVTMFTNIETLDMLVVDNLDLLVGNKIWEEALFHCFNRMIDSKRHIVITANVAPNGLSLGLADLKSRMTSGLVFEVKELNDDEKIEALKLRAKLRGLELTDVAARFLLYHYVRDTKNLFVVLEHLDKAALAAQRKLSVGFIKNVLG